MAATQVLCGVHAIEAALQRNAVLELFVDRNQAGRRVQDLLDQARALGVSVQKVAPDTLDRHAKGVRHQGVVAISRLPKARNESELADFLAGIDGPPLLLILDGVTDPHNLGACLRSADAAGVHAVIVPSSKSAGLNATVCKVASGAAERVPLFQVGNLARALKLLKKEGIWLVGTAGEADAALYDQDLDMPLGIVMGAEGAGIRRLTAEACDWLVHIPMAGSAESLNVSVATGVCLFEAVRQRKFAKSR